MSSVTVSRLLTLALLYVVSIIQSSNNGKEKRERKEFLNKGFDWLPSLKKWNQKVVCSTVRLLPINKRLKWMVGKEV